MTWSDDVHASRLAQSLSTARVERSLKRRNRPVVVQENSPSPVPAIAIIASVASVILLQRHRSAWEAIKWRQLPLVKQFYALVFGSGGTKLGNKAKLTTAQQQKRTAPSPTPSYSSPSMAAGAAAAARSEAAARGSPPNPPKAASPVPAKVWNLQ